MGESLTQPCRVCEEGLRVVKHFQWGANASGFSLVFERSAEEAQANSVPAAAVIRNVQTLFGITGLEECVGGFVSRV